VAQEKENKKGKGSRKVVKLKGEATERWGKKEEHLNRITSGRKLDQGGEKKNEGQKGRFLGKLMTVH